MTAMTPKVVKTEHATYTARSWTGADTSRIRPIGDTVVVLPDEASEKIGQKGLIVAPTDVVDRMSEAAESGIIVAVAEGAFVWSADRMRPYEGIKPKPGDRVHFARYTGQKVLGADGAMYRVMVDKSVLAIIEPPAE